MKIPVVSVLVATVSVGIGAAEPTANVERLIACSEIADQGARLACFDREVAPLVRTRKPAAPAPRALSSAAATAPNTAPPAQTAPGVAAPSFGEEQLKPKDQAAPATAEESLHARITGSTRGGQGTYLITLDNGQVWRHEQGSQVDYLKVGEAVTITRAAMGSYRLRLDSAKGSSWIRVTRVR